MSDEFSLINKTGKRLPRLPVLQLKNEILGATYDLSVAYVDAKTSQEINKKYRKKNKPTNVLSFSLSTDSGEIILCPEVIAEQTEKFERNLRELFGFLVIHGMLHLKGMEHSSKLGRVRMEAEEKKYDQKYFSRHRRGHRDDSGHRGRIHQRRKIS